MQDNKFKGFQLELLIYLELKIVAYFEYCKERVALYWNGISMSAARANAASFFDASVLSDMIFVKFTNWTNTEKQILGEVVLYQKQLNTDFHSFFLSFW